MADLSEEQLLLLHLVDRAEAGTLLAAEAKQLRDGIRSLASARRHLTDLLAKQQREEHAQERPGACCGDPKRQHWNGTGRCCASRCTCIGFVTN